LPTRRIHPLRIGVLLLLACLAAAVPGRAERPPRSADQQMLAVGAEIPGFGGLFRDSAGRRSAYLQDPSSPGAAALRQALGEVRILRGDFTFERLVAWKSSLRPLLASPQVVSIDADEASNRVVLGVAAEADVEALRAAVLASGVPPDAVVLTWRAEMMALPLPVTAAAKPPKGPTVQGRFRPVPGGVQIAFANFVCTLGFNAVREGVTGFVTNSHCTRVEGSPDGTRYAQPSGRAYLATETADPNRFEGGDCPPGRVCRFSDSAFVRWGVKKDASLARIARPSAPGSLRLANATHRFVINAVGTTEVGDAVNKVGRTTGWTSGQVIGTCADVNVAGETTTLLCQNVVQGASNSGDSGSPVFVNTGTNARLVGILWGGNAAAGIFVFSPLENVATELGTLFLN
jgi:hypothetical protein